MTEQQLALIARAKAIRAEVNILEGLHKTCQLTEIGLVEPILNESRYLARALADLAHFDVSDKEYASALQNAEHAVRCAINDAIDALVTFVKKSNQSIKKDYPAFDVATNPTFGKSYIEALAAMAKVEDEIVSSRTDRTKRTEIYKKLATSPTELEVIAKFALMLPRIEATAKTTKPGFTLGEEPHSSDEWILNHMRDAIESAGGDAKFSLALQPKYEKNGPRCVGAESLLRLNIGTANIPPIRFIKFAERSGLISDIGYWVLKETINILKNHPEIPCISVNVSPIELLDSEYFEKVKALVEMDGVAPERIELEITESAAINDTLSEHHLHNLAQLGVRIAIDDFGTGDTKFDYLAKMKVSVIKLDMSLVHKYARTPNEYRPLISAISAVGRECEIDLIAEGVESQEQAQLLDDIGISTFQGYLYGRPIPADEFFRTHTF